MLRPIAIKHLLPSQPVAARRLLSSSEKRLTRNVLFANMRAFHGN